MGKILQSYFGWEEVAYQVPPMKYRLPRFWYNFEYQRRALFWCGAAIARIQYLEYKQHNPVRASIIEWCIKVRNHCSEVIQWVI